MEKITIPLSLTKDEWVELVHALDTKRIWIETSSDVVMPKKNRKSWIKLLTRVYEKVSTIVENAGIEC